MTLVVSILGSGVLVGVAGFIWGWPGFVGVLGISVLAVVILSAEK